MIALAVLEIVLLGPWLVVDEAPPRTTVRFDPPRGRSASRSPW